MAGVSANPMIGYGNINSAYGYSPPQQMTATQGMPMGTDTSGGIDSVLGNTLASVIGSAPSIYGSQNAAEAQNKGILAGIGTQQTTMGNINALYGNQIAAGNGAFGNLQSVFGLNGAAPDYTKFQNAPGYQFAVNQGTQAINRQAAAAGSLYTPNTLDAVGQYVTGTASQNYNNYVQQLLSTAGLGAQGNNALSTANLQTGGNISQLQQNSGNAQASGINSMYGPNGVGGILSGLNASGVFGQGGLGGLLGKGIGALGGAIGNIFGGSNGNQTGGTGISDMTNGQYNGGAFGGGAPYYDPTTGGYPSTDTNGNLFGGNGPLYDPSTGGYPGGGTGTTYDPSTGLNTDTSTGNIDWNFGDTSGNP